MKELKATLALILITENRICNVHLLFIVNLLCLTIDSAIMYPFYKPVR